MRFHSEVPLASLLAYSPRGQSDVSASSRRACYGIKRGRLDYLERAAKLARQHLHRDVDFDRFLGESVTLVPVPRSYPLEAAGDLWPARRICDALRAAGLARDVLPCLSRTEAAPRSATARQGHRPDADVHYETLAAKPILLAPGRLTLVDDVVTRGTTLIAAASRVQEAFPDAEVRAFAVIRTMGLVLEIEQIVDPQVGWIRHVDGRTTREP